MPPTLAKKHMIFFDRTYTFRCFVGVDVNLHGSLLDLWLAEDVGTISSCCFFLLVLCLLSPLSESDFIEVGK